MLAETSGQLWTPQIIMTRPGQQKQLGHMTSCDMMHAIHQTSLAWSALLVQFLLVMCIRVQSGAAQCRKDQRTCPQESCQNTNLIVRGCIVQHRFAPYGKQPNACCLTLTKRLGLQTGLQSANTQEFAHSQELTAANMPLGCKADAQ